MAVLLRYYDPTNNDEHHEEHDRQDRPAILFVPPSVAASVGLHSFASPHHGCTQDAYLTTTIPTHNNRQPPAVAYKASLRPIGIPPTDYLPPLSKAHRIHMENYHSHHDAKHDTTDPNKDDAAIRSYFSKIGESSQRQRRLLTVGSLFGVVVSDHDTHSEQMRFYRVEQLSFHTYKNETDESSPSHHQLVSHGWVSPNETEVTLLPSSSHVATMTTSPRLPNVSMAYSFDQSIGIANKNSGVNMQTPAVPLIVPARHEDHPHASMEAMVNALLIPVSESSSWMPPILHVIGKEENHVDECIAAAASIGM
jgi:hypothetical protein